MNDQQLTLRSHEGAWGEKERERESKRKKNDERDGGIEVG